MLANTADGGAPPPVAASTSGGSMEPYGSPKWPDPDPPRPKYLPHSQRPPDPPHIRPPIKHSSIAAILFLFGVLALVCAGAYFSGELRQFLYGSSPRRVRRPGQGWFRSANARTLCRASRKRTRRLARRHH
jgi:hypothetical protein